MYTIVRPGCIYLYDSKMIDPDTKSPLPRKNFIVRVNDITHRYPQDGRVAYTILESQESKKHDVVRLRCSVSLEEFEKNSVFLSDEDNFKLAKF